MRACRVVDRVAEPVVGGLQLALDDLTAGGIHEHFGTSLVGRRLETTDFDWSYGSGLVLRGKAGDLALALCGRAVPPGRLEGDSLRLSPTTPAPCGAPQ